MRKFKLVMAALGLACMPFMAGNSVAAASTCQEGYTGPDSNNLCTSIVTYTCTVINDNTVQVDNANTQISVSGNAGSEGGTGGGGAVSGSATNANGVTFNATVTNNDVCTVTATTPAIASPSAPVANGGGRGGGASMSSPESVVKPLVKEEMPPAVLADTSGDITPRIVAGIVAIGTIGVIAIRLLMNALTRKHS